MHSVLRDVFGVILLSAACTRGEPPAPAVDASVAPLPPPGDHADASDGATSTAIRDAAAKASLPEDGGIDPGTLPQTHDKPRAEGHPFDARIAALWDAVVADDPDRGIIAFFPLAAYEQVKAIPNPASDWKHRLVAAYGRDIHALHKRLGESAASAKLVRAEVPEDRARWVEPNEETNKLGYYRVYGTRIVYDVDHKERSFDVSSLISWRGEWYVVHLSGFK
ncbi:MAG: hypothetical protein FWD69_11365 [Polyangiaceae bacterium]|nr:hypothetical protein [Polyangiaceae bacterium]